MTVEKFDMQTPATRWESITQKENVHPSRPVRPSRLAIIGVSGYAAVLLDSLAVPLADQRARLVAATAVGSDRETEAAGKLRADECEIFPDYRDMLRAFEGRIDLCVIPTSIHWHARMSVDALHAGAHVLVEKPLAGGTRDALKITAASHAADRFVAVGFQDMFLPVTRQLKAFLISGELGAQESVTVCGSWPRALDYYTRNDWAGRQTKDGWAVADSPLNNAFAHFLNLALYFAHPDLTGFAEISACKGELFRHYPIETFDTANVWLTTVNGVNIRCVFTHFDPVTVDPQMTIRLAGGSLVWKFEKQAVAFDRSGKVIRTWPLGTAEEARQAMIGNVLGCLANGEAPLFTAKDARCHVRAVEAITQSVAVREGDGAGERLFVSLLNGR